MTCCATSRRFSFRRAAPVSYTHLISDFKVGNYNARNYTVCYSAENHGPVWVAAPLHNCYVTKSGNRSYSQDPDVPAGIQPASKSLADPYNKGHMLGNRERSRTAVMRRQVCYYTNIAPQHSGTFNTGGGAWNNLEDLIDTYWDSTESANVGDTLYVVVGAYYKTWTDSYGNTASPKKAAFGGQQTGVPTMFYYAMLRTRNAKSGKSVLRLSLIHIYRVLDELNKQVTQLIYTMNYSVDNAFADFDRQRDELQRYVTGERQALVEQLRQTAGEVVRTTLDAVPGLVGKVLLYVVLALAVLIGGPFALGFWLGGVRARAGAKRKE